MIHQIAKVYGENIETNEDENCISEYEDNTIINMSDVLNFLYNLSERINMILF